MRGLAVLLMLPINAGMEFRAIPAWFKHAPHGGMTIADFIMPAFLFALGLSQAFSLERRREKDGLARTLGHAFLRNAILFVFGSLGYFLVWQQGNWEILQMLGITGAIAFPFLFLAPPYRALAALALVCGIEALRPAFFEPGFQAWYASGIGGPAGAIPLAVIVIAASIIGGALHDRPPLLRGVAAAVIGVAILGSGLAFSRWIPTDKHMLSLSYLLIATGTACICLALLEGASALVAGRAKAGKAKARTDLRILGPLGRNPLVAYMAGGVLTLIARAIIPPDAGALLAWSASLGVLAIITVAAIILDRKGVVIRL